MVAPVRIGLSASELALTAALGVVHATRELLRRDGFAGSAEDRWGPRWHQRFASPSVEYPPAPPRPPAKAPPPAPEAVSPPPPVAPARAAGPAVPVVPPSPGAKQVDDEPIPVAEFGEEEADSPVGAEVQVEAPWDGYDGMTAVEVQGAIAAAERETVAAVALYEQSRRARRSVIRAADKRLRALSASFGRYTA